VRQSISYMSQQFVLEAKLFTDLRKFVSAVKNLPYRSSHMSLQTVHSGSAVFRRYPRHLNGWLRVGRQEFDFRQGYEFVIHSPCPAFEALRNIRTVFCYEVSRNTFQTFIVLTAWLCTFLSPYAFE
jgi:hypothetical protein